MKNLRKIIALLIAVITVIGVFAIPATVNAADADETEEPIVARMYLGHKPRNYNMSGHTWIYIENLTNHDIQVGAFTVKKGKGVSTGTYGTQINDGKGLYYNVEAWRYKNSDPASYYYLYKDLTESQLEKVSSRILMAGTWSYILNCGYYALGIWNCVPGKTIMFLVWPFLTQVQMLLDPDCSTGFPMIKPKKTDCYKQVGTGNQAYLIQVDPTNPKEVKEDATTAAAK